MENLKRIREPLSWTLVVVAALALIYELAQLWWLAHELSYTVGFDGSVVEVVGWLTSLRQVDYTLLVILTIAVVSCWVTPVVPRARVMAQLAAWVATLVVALPWIVAVVLALTEGQPAQSTGAPWDLWTAFSLLYPLINTVVGVVAAIALWALARRPADGPDEDEPDAGTDELEAAGEAATDQPEPEHPTVWKPAEATGTVWRTADEAAAGAPGTHAFASAEVEVDPTPPASEWAEHPTSTHADDWRPPTRE